MEPAGFKRGDVVLLPFPYIQNYAKAKTRPAVIIQNDIGNRYSPNLIVALISSSVPPKTYPIHYKISADSDEGRAAGLDVDSIVKAETIITVPKQVVIKKIGALPQNAMDKLDACLKVSLGL
jgi:mRNA interferase MazF